MTIYHAFVQTPDELGEKGHLAQVPYSDLESALEHVQYGYHESCPWGAVIEGDGKVHYLFGNDPKLMADAIERLDWY